MKRTLYRSRENKVVAGIFGGLGEHFDVDPILLRLLYLFVLVCTGIVPGIIAYLIAISIVPLPPMITPSTPVVENDDTKV